VSTITTKQTTMEEEESLHPCPKAHKHDNLVYVSRIMGEGWSVGVGMGRKEFCLGRKLFFFLSRKRGGRAVHPRGKKAQFYLHK